MGTPHPANFWSQRHPLSEAQFRMQHHLSHATYEKRLTQTYGIALASLDLTAPINKDWLFRHDSRHQAMLSITQGRLGAVNNAPTVDLSSLDPRDERAFRAWMQYHAQLHENLDIFFGVTT
jgi:hypothetical protein